MLSDFIQSLSTWVWGWPLVIFMMATSIILTIITHGIQIRYFFRSWYYVLFPERSASDEMYITPFQAFVNTLSASIGNGSAAGMATAMYSGGPGAAFWIFVLGFFNMALRFCEVFVSTSFTDHSSAGVLRGGPMVFLKHVPGHQFLPSLYAFFCLFVSFVAGSAMQCNSMAISIKRMSHWNSWIIAMLLFIVIAYMMLGGAQRIIHISERVIPFKVGLFFAAIIIILWYHSAHIVPALKLIVAAAFEPQAVQGALAGHTIQNAIRFGMSRSLSATEAGLGTAGVLYGATASRNPVRSGIMSMSSIFISNHLVCFTLMVIFVATGVWNSGLTSTAMTSAAFETVFGCCGSWIVTFLSIIFGLGVLVAYAYIGRECWIFLTGGRFVSAYGIIFSLCALMGSLARVESVWNAVDIGNAGMLVINVYGLIMLVPYIRSSLAHYMYHEQG
jgi:AGCS family alanine or glycine:cation symporter